MGSNVELLLGVWVITLVFVYLMYREWIHGLTYLIPDSMEARLRRIAAESMHAEDDEDPPGGEVVVYTIEGE